ncbi:Glutamate synthase [NADPH] large chain precursor [Raoultella terrigena]|uniref:Glutamate synthase [NADPH] large chain n=1 Tax=Raoultella terrigena TaxID=577 RepID=A0A4U9D893_RAOTE|nr:Glutamate synthase [NADPH] large chain precursor [Raoultella terrigena]
MNITPITGRRTHPAAGGSEREYRDYQQYSQLVNERPAATLRDLLALNPGDEAIDIAHVESAKELYKRFDTAAMSIGALSPEAHESLAEAMNSIAASPTPAKAAKTRRATHQQSVAHQAGCLRPLRRHPGLPG